MMKKATKLMPLLRHKPSQNPRVVYTLVDQGMAAVDTLMRISCKLKVNSEAPIETRCRDPRVRQPIKRDVVEDRTGAVRAVARRIARWHDSASRPTSAVTPRTPHTINVRARGPAGRATRRRPPCRAPRHRQAG